MTRAFTKPVPSFLAMALVATLGGMPASPAAAAAEAGASAFDRIGSHYEAIRLELLRDENDSVATHAESIGEIAGELAKDYSAEAAGLPGDAEAADDVKELLPEVTKKAEALSSAEDLTAQREALAELTKPLVRWRAHVEGEKPVVAYCSMERKAWLQPDGEIGNPYGGTRMPRCGKIVQR